MTTLETTEAVVVWQPGIYVLWGDVDDENYAQQRGTVVEHKVAAGRGDHGEDLSHYTIKREHDGLIVHLDGSEIAPAYKDGLDVIPDADGNPVRVGDWIEYERAEGGVVPVLVTAVKAQRPFADRYAKKHTKKHTDKLDLRYSGVSVKGYGSGLDCAVWDVSTLNFRGDWSGSRSRDSQGSDKMLRKIALTEEQINTLELAAERRQLETLVAARAKLDTRIAQSEDRIATLRRQVRDQRSLGKLVEG